YPFCAKARRDCRMAYLRSSKRCCEEGVARQISRAETEVVRVAIHRRRKRNQYRRACRRSQTRVRRMALGRHARTAGPGGAIQTADLRTRRDGIRAVRARALMNSCAGQVPIDFLEVIEPRQEPVQFYAGVGLGNSVFKLANASGNHVAIDI